LSARGIIVRLGKRETTRLAQQQQQQQQEETAQQDFAFCK
jgi:hypothetical protein